VLRRSQIASALGYGYVAVVTLVALIGTPGLARGALPSTGARITDNLYGTAFVSALEGWVVGAFGVIYHTQDGGKSWQPQLSHTQEPLFDVSFPDRRDGWVVGRTGLILHTADGGDTWEAQKSGVEKHLFSVDFANPDFGCAVGDWGTIVLTTDGGKTWEPRPLPRDVILNGVSLVDRQHGWIVGEAGAILATTDSGTTWTEQSSGIDKSLFGVHFADLRRGWAVGIDAIILHTEDGGATWQVQHGSTTTDTLEQVGFAEAFDNPSLYAVTVVKDQGIATGDLGTIFHSSDGGQTWAREPTPPGWDVSWLRSVSLVPGTHGAIVGAAGHRILVDGGRIELPHGK